MGCGASAGRGVDSPKYAADAAPSAQTPRKPEEASGPEHAVTASKDGALTTPQQTAGVIPSVPLDESDELEGLLIDIELKKAKGSTATGASPSSRPVNDAPHLSPGGKQGQSSGELQQLLRELEAPPPASPSKDSSLRGKQATLPLLPKQDVLSKPLDGHGRQLAPLKVMGRVPLASGPAPLQPLGLLPATLPQLSPLTRVDSDLEQPDSATLLTIDHRWGGSLQSTTSSVSSPSTAKTTYITFDILADRHLDRAGSGPLDMESAVPGEQQQEAGRSGEGGGDHGWRVPKHGKPTEPAAVLEQRAAEVDELLRDVFDDEQAGPPAGSRAQGSDGSGRTSLLPGEALQQAEKHANGSPVRSTQVGNEHAGRHSESGSVDDLWKSLQAATKEDEKSRERAPEVSPTGGAPSTGESVEAKVDNGGSAREKPSLSMSADGVNDAVLRFAIPTNLDGPLPSKTSSTPWGGAADGACVLDLDDLEDIAGEEEGGASTPGQEAEARDAPSTHMYRRSASKAGSDFHEQAASGLQRSEGVVKYDSWQAPRRRSSASDNGSEQQNGPFDEGYGTEDILILDTDDLEDE